MKDSFVSLMVICMIYMYMATILIAVLCCHILDLDVTITCDHEALRLEDSAPCQRYDSGARHVVLLL